MSDSSLGNSSILDVTVPGDTNMSPKNTITIKKSILIELCYAVENIGSGRFSLQYVQKLCSFVRKALL